MTTELPSMTLSRRLQGYETLLEAVRAAPGARPFVTTWEPGEDPESVTHTFDEFLGLAEGFAHFYTENGLRAGDTVVLIMPQGVALMAAFAGSLMLSAIPTILAYPTFKIDPDKYRTGLSGVTANLQARLVVLDKAFPADLLSRIAVSGGMRIVQPNPSELPSPTQRTSWASPSPDDVAFIQHSAGTTGLQKGVALPHRSVLNQLRHLVDSLSITDEDRIVSWLPLYHDMGLVACFILPLVCHLHVAMESPTDWVMRPGSMLTLASGFRSTLCWIPNFAFQFMARRVPEEERQGLDLSSLRAMVNCSEPVSAESMEEFYTIYRENGLPRSCLHASYAMAENTFAVTQTVVDGGASATTIRVDRDVLANEGRVELLAPGTESALILVSSGRCLEANEVAILGRGGTHLADGNVGEILVRSDSVFQGYFGRPDLTAKALHDGWYHTGDVGFLWDGELYVMGRKDDLIIVAGKNLYPQDIESIAFAHPSVHDGRAVAFGLFNPDLGTQDLIVIAEVEKENDLQRASEIEGAIRREILGGIGLAPRMVALVPPRWLVKSTAGKPARSTNKAKLLKERPELNPKERGHI